MNNQRPIKPRTRGPVEFAFEVAFGLLFVTLFSWFIGIVIEIAGGMFFWEKKGIAHAQEIVQQDVAYISEAPRSLLVNDTAAFTQLILKTVEYPYEKFGVIKWYKNNVALAYANVQAKTLGLQEQRDSMSGIRNTSKQINSQLSEWAVITMLVAQDVLLRMSVAAFALPAFVLALLIGVVDGLVRRDLRRWGGGRESSFVYHHAKRYTKWALTGGFGLYLAWPFGGFNPAYMVLVFSVLVAISLSTTVAAFKKYV